MELSCAVDVRQVQDVAVADERAAPVSRPGRVVFVDLARVVAILLMVQGHTLDALLAPEYRTSAAFHAWSFGRGLTSCLFFFLAGFAFALATYTHSGERRASAAGLRRFRRVTLFLLIGYALHSPMASLGDITNVTAEKWTAFVAVDALQCLAVTLTVLQVFALRARSSRQFLLLSLLAAIAIVTATPAVARADWNAVLPLSLAAYLTADTGSLFPVFPWVAYSLVGAAMGAAYVCAARPGWMATRVLGATGGAMLIGSIVGTRLPWEPLGRTDYWSTSPNQFLLRAGLVCTVVAALALASRRITRLPAALEALARHSLLVYAAHLCVVYGSAWNRGLRYWYGHALPFGSAVLWTVALWLAVIALANCRHACSRLQAMRVVQRITRAAETWRVGRRLGSA
jgi:surface polysaccharide O-acyltransferase-like enzyme